MKVRDGQSERIDGLELRKDFGLIADLFGVQIVGDTEQPMLRPRFAGVLWGVELVDGDKCRPASNASALYGLFRHRRNGDIPHLYIARFNLPSDHLRDKMILAVVSHQAWSECRGQEVIVERVLLGDGVAADGIAIV